MNEREENKELIQLIAETLRDHAEPYKEGAWERFSAMQGVSGKRVLWPYWSAAAVLLIAAGLFLFRPKPETPAVDLVNLTTQPEQPIAEPLSEPQASTTPPRVVAEPEPESPAVSTTPEKTQISHTQEEEPVAEEPSEAPLVVAPAVTDAPAEQAPSQAPPSSPIDTPESSETPQRLAVVSPPPDEPEMTSIQSAAEASRNVGARSDAARKWDLGIAVAPSMTSEKLNLSGGIAVAYQLSDKFSVGSGVSIGRLGMAENSNYDPYAGRQLSPNSPPSSGTVPTFASNREQYKRDISLTSSVVALDIPLDLRYEIFNGFYTSVGVSYVAVLSEQRTEHFIGGINEASFGADKGGNKNLEASTTVRYRSEKIDAQPLKGKGYTGFMNFSIGRKMSLSKHLFFSIEPYFKLPIGQLSREQMDFTNGGIRIVTGF